MTETVWLTAARAWNMPVSRMSADDAARLGLTGRPNDWCQVRPCNAAGRQEEGFLAKIACVLEIAPPGYPTERRPRELNFRKPDVVIGTRDWESVERFLCNMEPDKIARLRETRQHHVRVVLQSGERWYLNLLVSETVRRSRITSAAVAKLGRGSVHDKHMHLRDVNGTEVSITVDVVDERVVERRELPHRITQAAHGADSGGRAAHPRDDAHQMDGEGCPPQGVGQPEREEGPTRLRGERKRSRGAGVLQTPQGED
jgi:hypothetical protein